MHEIDENIMPYRIKHAPKISSPLTGKTNSINALQMKNVVTKQGQNKCKSQTRNKKQERATYAELLVQR